MRRDVEHFLDMRSCDCCGKETIDSEQSSCVTSHVELEDYPFLSRQCFNDEFYCDQCLNKYGFCNKCAEDISLENQKKYPRQLTKNNCFRSRSLN